jgi:vacuolar protein sorting-associated protein 13A/C
LTITVQSAVSVAHFWHCPYSPIIIIPEDVTQSDCQHIVLDAGYISVNSELVDKDAVAEIRAKANQQYSDADFEKLESLVYDKYHIKLQSAQLLMANTLEECMQALKSDSSPQIHILDRINIAFKAETCIVAKAPNLTRFRILGDLPDLHIHFSDRKYKRLMRMIDVVIPKFDDGAVVDASSSNGSATTADAKSTHTNATYRQAQLYVDTDDALSLGEHTDIESDDEDARPKRQLQAPSTPGKDKDDGEDKFYEPGEIVEGVSKQLYTDTSLSIAN